MAATVTHATDNVKPAADESKADCGTDASVPAAGSAPNLTLWLHILRHAKNMHRSKSDTPDDPGIKGVGWVQALTLSKNLRNDIDRPEYSHPSDKTTPVGGGAATTDAKHHLVLPLKVMTSTARRAKQTAQFADLIRSHIDIEAPHPPFSHAQLDELTAKDPGNGLAGMETVGWLWALARSAAAAARNEAGVDKSTPVTARFVVVTHAIRIKYMLQAVTCPTLHVAVPYASLSTLTLRSGEGTTGLCNRSPHVVVHTIGATQACVSRIGRGRQDTEPANYWNCADARKV